MICTHMRMACVCVNTCMCAQAHKCRNMHMEATGQLCPTLTRTLRLNSGGQASTANTFTHWAANVIVPRLIIPTWLYFSCIHFLTHLVSGISTRNAHQPHRTQDGKAQH